MSTDDEKSRKKIAQDLDHNYFVEASAGSGKTYSLVLRMVALIEKGTPVDKICTITFTKAAANEFFSRFQDVLSVRSVETPDKYEKDLGEKKTKTMARCQEALANIDLCFLGTIDAFLNMVAHELPFQLKLPSDSEVIDNNERSRLVGDIYSRILNDPSDKHHKKALKVDDLFKGGSNSFVKVFSVVSKHRNCDIIYDKTLCNTDFNTLFTSAQKDEFIRLIELLCSEDVAYSTTVKANLEKIKNQKELKANLYYVKNKDWFNPFIISKIADAIRNINKMEPISKKDVDADSLVTAKLVKTVGSNSNLPYSDEARALFDNISSTVENYKHSVMLDFVVSVMDDICDELKELGALDYFDYLYYVTNEFKKSASSDRVLVNHILERHSHFLLDESQDTNPMQTELFFYLTGTKKTTDWTKAEPKEGSLFIVGDPKQSIYGFRGASVQAYLKTKAIFEAKDEVLYLTKNFRSREVLKEWFNSSMNSVLDHGIEKVHHPRIPIDDNKKNEENDDFAFDNNKFTLYQGAYKYISKKSGEDPEAIAKIITKLVHKHEDVIVKKNGEKGYVSYGDIRVVPRSKTVDDFVKVFTEYNIPTIIEAKIPFNKSQILMVIKDILSLLKNPADKTAFIFVAFGNLYKFNSHDILQMKIDGFDFDISKEPITFSDTRYQSVVDSLHRAFLKTKDMSFSSTLLYIINDEDLNIYKHVDTTYLEYAFFLVEKIKEKEETGLISSFKECEDFIKTFIDDNDEDDRTLRFKNDLDKVILSNVHKVKGLQAPVVILAKPFQQNHDVDLFTDYQTPSKPSFTLEKLSSDDPNSKFFYVKRNDVGENEKDIWVQYSRAEKERIEYVGATRAESVLIVGRAESLAKNYNDPWADLSNCISDENIIPIPEVDPITITPDDVSIGCYNKNINCNNQSIKYHLPSSSYGDIKLSSTNNNLDNMCEDFESREDATIVGTMVHKLMEKIVSSHNSFSDIEEAIVDIMLNYGGMDYHDLLLDVYNTITSGGYPQKNSEVEQDILSVLMNAEEVSCETPFSYKRKDETIVSGIIDLIYKDKDGYHIIDYKTNQEDDVSILEKEYAGQLSDYQEALKEFGIIADAHIYHIDAK